MSNQINTNNDIISALYNCFSKELTTRTPLRREICWFSFNIVFGGHKKKQQQPEQSRFKKGIKVFPSGGDGACIDNPTFEAIIVINVTILNDHDFCLEMICLIEKFIMELNIAYVGSPCRSVYIFVILTSCASNRANSIQHQINTK